MKDFVVKDQVFREVCIQNYPPQRVVSLCPSVTETLIEVGVSVVGRTKFCIHPKEIVQNIPKVGGTKQVDYEKIANLSPDIIIAVKEENTMEMVLNLEKKFPVFVTDVQSWNEALVMLETFGNIFSKQFEIQHLIQEILSNAFPNGKQRTVLYLIWKNPYMAAGQSTYINDILRKMNFHNVALELAGRYPEISDNWIRSKQPDLIFLSTEPFPFQEKHIKELQNICPSSQILLVDGEAFSWYGSRMKKAFKEFQRIVEKLESDFY